MKYERKVERAECRKARGANWSQKKEKEVGAIIVLVSKEEEEGAAQIIEATKARNRFAS